MIAQKQTILSDERKGTIGNCLAACIASIFDMPIVNIPHFSWYGSEWFSVFLKFLKQNEYDFNGTWQIKNEPDWAEKFKGIDGFVIVGGKSPRNVPGGHAVIYKDGQPFFDPHPSDAFLSEPEDIYLIVRKQA